MHKPPYSKFLEDEFILRDYLAIDRTILANERTFLAYLRTALTVFIAGVTFIKFFDNLLLEIIGWFFVPISVFTFIVGTNRFQKFKSQMHKFSDYENNHTEI